LTRFLKDWTAMWRGELQDQATDPEAIAAAAEMWRAAMAAWTDTLGVPPVRTAASRDRNAPSRAQAAAAASDARDAEIERLARRVDELEARIAKLEPTPRRRG